MAEEPNKVTCPNCQGTAVKEGNKVICESCDATFTITKTGSAKVKDIGRLNDHEERIKKLENLLPGEEPEPEPEPNDDPILPE